MFDNNYICTTMLNIESQMIALFSNIYQGELTTI